MAEEPKRDGWAAWYGSLDHSTRKRLASAIALAPLFALLVLLLASSRGPRYEFDFRELTAPSDARELIDLAERISRVRRWKPPWLSDASAPVLAELVRLNGTAEDLKDLLRASAGPGDREFQAKIASSNGTIQLLAGRITPERFADLKSLPTEELTDALQEELAQALAEERETAIEALLDEPGIRRLFERYGLPPLPGRAGWLRRAGCWLVRKPLRDRDIWLDSFEAAKTSHLVPLDEWYRRVEAAGRIEMGDAPSGLVLVRMVPSAGRRTVHYAGRSTTADFNVLLRRDTQTSTVAAAGAAHLGAGASPERAIDTGLRAFRVRLMETGDDRAESSSDSSERRVRIQWPPGSLVIAPEVFERCLRQLCLPRGFSVRDLAPLPLGHADAPVCTVRFRVYCLDLPACQWDAELDFGAKDPQKLKQQLAGLGRSAALARLRDYVRHLTEYAGMPVAFSPVEDDPNRFKCQVRPAGLEPVELSAGISEEGRLVWSGVPSVAERSRIARRICQEIRELRGLDPLLSIDSVRLQRSPAGLTGTLSVLGSVVGLEDVEEVPWVLSARGPVSVRLPEPARRGVAALRDSRDSSAQAPASEAVAIEERIREHVRAHYLALSEQIELVRIAPSRFGMVLDLGLRIADWPQIRLGPRIVTPKTEIGPLVDALLTQESVCRAAARQWAASRSHPRYGPVLSMLESWSPHQPRAAIQCRLDLPGGLTLPWTEEIRLQSGRWVAGNDDLCRHLEGYVEVLEHQLGEYLSQWTGGRLKIRLDRSAFGPGRWLRLNPPTLAFDARLWLPGMPAGLGGGRILVDPDGVHWPEKLSFTYFTTFNVPPTPTPWCALSDPRITVDFARSGLSIGAKMTPPVPDLVPPAVRRRLFSGASVSADPQDAAPAEEGLWPPVRIDNPWLHAVYLEGEFGGNLRDLELTADANLRLLDHYDAARAHLRCSLKAKGAHAATEARPVSVAGWPELKGELWLSASGELDLGAHTRVAGCRVDGRLTYLWRPAPGRIMISGRARLPLIGQARVRGSSDVLLEDPQINARAPLSLPLGNSSGQMICVFHADRSGYQLEYVLERPQGGTARSVRAGPTLETLSEEELRRELEALAARGVVPAPSEAETQAIERLKPVPEHEGRNGETDVEPDQPDPLRPADRRLAGSVRWERLQDRGIRLFSEAKPSETILLLTERESGISDPKSCCFVLWRHSAPQRDSALLVIDGSSKDVKLFHGLAGKLSGSPQDLTQTFIGVQPRFPTVAQADSGALLARKVMIMYCLLRMHNRAPSAPRRVGSSGYLIEYKSKASDETRKAAAFCWEKAGAAYMIGLVEPVVPAAERDSHFEWLSGLKPRRSRGLLISHDAASGRFAILTPGHGRAVGKAGERYELTLYGDSEERSLALGVPTGNAQHFLETVKACAEAIRRQNLPADGLTAWIGPEGACLADGRTGFWLLPGRGPAENKAVYVSRRAFDEWERDTRRFLPDDLHDRRARQILSPEDIARMTVREWERSRGLWGANPMGLLLGLAEKQPQ